MAGWLYRNLRREVDQMVVCDHRRNALITRDGDKTNPIDAEKLSELLAGGNLWSCGLAAVARRLRETITTISNATRRFVPDPVRADPTS